MIPINLLPVYSVSEILPEVLPKKCPRNGEKVNPEKFSRLNFISEMEPEGPEKFRRLNFISEIPPPPRLRRIAAPTKPGLVPLMARTAGPVGDRYPTLKQLVSAGTGPVAR